MLIVFHWWDGEKRRLHVCNNLRRRWHGATRLAEYCIHGFNFTANSPFQSINTCLFLNDSSQSGSQHHYRAFCPVQSRWYKYNKYHNHLETYHNHSASKEVVIQLLFRDSISSEAAIIPLTKAIIGSWCFKISLSLGFTHQRILVPESGFIIMPVAMLSIAKQWGLMRTESHFLSWQNSHRTFHQHNGADLSSEEVFGLQVDYSVYRDAYRNIIINYPHSVIQLSHRENTSWGPMNRVHQSSGNLIEHLRRD